MFAVFSNASRGKDAVEKLWIASEGFLSTFRSADAEMYCGHCLSLFQTFLSAQLADGLPSKRNSVSNLYSCIQSSPKSQIDCLFCSQYSATCAYLSCKTEEFNVSIDQFVGNIKGDRIKAMDIILSNELLLMQQLNYYLTIHNPFRPIEGFLIDIKTRCSMVNPDRLRAGIDEFIDKAFLTDACLLFSPSQLALAAVLNSASKEQENLDSYVTGSLFHDATIQLKDLVDAVKSTLEIPDLLWIIDSYCFFRIIQQKSV